MKTRRLRSATDLNESIRHVGYELTTMVRQLGMMEHARLGRSEPEVQVAFEAALLHARNMIEFLTYSAKGDTTMHSASSPLRAMAPTGAGGLDVAHAWPSRLNSVDTTSMTITLSCGTN